MITPTELGRLAHAKGINAPTLDEAMIKWLENNQDRPKAECMVRWWAGWYEDLDKEISGSSKRLII